MGKRSRTGMVVAFLAVLSLALLTAGCAPTKSEAVAVEPSPAAEAQSALAAIIEAQKAGASMITVSEIRSGMASAKPPVVTDVRPAFKYAAEHVKGAVNLPLLEISAKAAIVLPDKAAEVIVYSANYACPNSLKASMALKDLGYTNVHVYKGGMQEWTLLALPVEGEAPSAAPAQQVQNEE